MKRPSYANVAASLALLVALSGGAYAASLPRGSVGTAQLKNGAVTAKKIAPGTAVAPGRGVRTANKQLEPCAENVVLSMRIKPRHRSRLLGISAGNWHANQVSTDNDYELVSYLQLREGSGVVGRTANLSNESLGGEGLGEDQRQPIGSSGVLLDPDGWAPTVLRAGRSYTLEMIGHTYGSVCANNPMVETAQLSYVLLSDHS